MKDRKIMKGQKIMKELSNIKPEYIYEGEFGKFSDKTQTRRHPRKLAVILLAACLVFALAATAYAANLFGIRDMFRTDYRELPEGAADFIQQENVSAVNNGWSCEITESLGDSSTAMVTVAVHGGDQYIVVPTDAMPDDSVSLIGLSGEQTLAELAKEQGKKLLFVGATITKIGDEEIGNGSQRMENISESEMVILTTVTRTAPTSDTNAVCLVYALEEGSQNVEDVQRVELPFTLSEAPAVQEGLVYHPLDPDAIPGLTVGDMTIEETALGYNIRMLETVTDQDAYYNLMKTEIEGITFGEGGGAVMLEDGSYQFQANMCQGTLEDKLIVRFYDWDKQPLGEIEFSREIN